jgi:hypothetical protein
MTKGLGLGQCQRIEFLQRKQLMIVLVGLSCRSNKFVISIQPTSTREIYPYPNQRLQHNRKPPTSILTNPTSHRPNTTGNKPTFQHTCLTLPQTTPSATTTTINQEVHDRIHYTASAGDGETKNSFPAAHHLAYITFFHVIMSPRNSDQVRLQDTPKKSHSPYHEARRQ